MNEHPGAGTVVLLLRHLPTLCLIALGVAGKLLHFALVELRIYHAVGIAHILHIVEVAQALFLFGVEGIALKLEVELNVLAQHLPGLVGISLGFLLVANHLPSLGQVATATHIVDRNVVFGDFLLGLVQHIDSLLLLAVECQLDGCARKQTAVGPAHAHRSLVDIETGMAEVAVLEAVHHSVVGLVGVEALGVLSTRVERRDAVGKSLLDEVVAKVHEVLLTNGRSHVDRTCPVAVGDNLEHHQVALAQIVVTGERDGHPVGDAVNGHEHTALLHGILVDGQEEGIRGDAMQVVADVVAGISQYVLDQLALLRSEVVAYPVLHDVLQFERILAEDLLGIFRIGVVEVSHLLLHIRVDTNLVVGSLYVVVARPADGQSGRTVGRTLHLVDIPVGIEIAQIADAGIRADALYFLVVPEREGIVVAIGEDNRVLAGERAQIVGAKVAAGAGRAAR